MENKLKRDYDQYDEITEESKLEILTTLEFISEKIKSGEWDHTPIRFDYKTSELNLHFMVFKHKELDGKK